MSILGGMLRAAEVQIGRKARMEFGTSKISEMIHGEE